MTRPQRAFVSIRPIHALVAIALATTAAATLTVTSVFLGWPLCVNCPDDDEFVYIPRSDRSPEVNAAMARFYELSGRKTQWTSDDWAWLKQTAAKPGFELRELTIYTVGAQAKHGRITNDRTREWTRVVRPMLEDPDEHVRAAALYALKHLDAPRDFDLSNDPSDLVRITWRNHYGP